VSEYFGVRVQIQVRVLRPRARVFYRLIFIRTIYKNSRLILAQNLRTN